MSLQQIVKGLAAQRMSQPDIMHELEKASSGFEGICRELPFLLLQLGGKAFNFIQLRLGFFLGFFERCVGVLTFFAAHGGM